jgi:uncharacterized protein (TIGR02466 family)
MIDIFPIKINKVKYTGDIATIKQIVLSLLPKTLDNNQSSMRGNGICSYNVLRNLHTCSVLKSLIEFINQQAQLYWTALNYDVSMRPEVYEMWANIYKQGSFIESHTHAPIHMTASFYLQMPDGGGNIAFDNPNTTLLKYQPYALDAIRYGQFEHEVTVETGDLVIFPGWLAHKTKPNGSVQDRIIIGANICNVV